MARLSDASAATRMNFPLPDDAHVFVIDVVNGFLKEGQMADPDMCSILPAIAHLLSHVGDNVTYICEQHEADDLEFNAFPPHCIRGTREAQIVEELAPYLHVNSKIITKRSTNGFHALHADKAYLDQLMEGEKTFVLVGDCTDICVLQFALSLRTYCNEYGYNHDVMVLIDGVDTYDAPWHKVRVQNEIALTLMQQAGILLSNSFRGESWK